MNFGTATGKIDRRVLVNYACDPEFVRPLVPEALDLQLVKGKAVVGICLIRLTNMRPTWLPSFLGISSENIAHRFAIEFDDKNGDRKTGVYVPIRHSDSLLTTTIGTRLYPGVYKPAKFTSNESDGDYNISAKAKDGSMTIEIQASKTDDFKSELFGSFEEESRFFECSSTGFSPDTKGCELEGVVLKTNDWKMQALDVHHVFSSFYSDTGVFPKGSVVFDSALLMENLDVTWES